MGNNSFKFKQFTVFHDRCAMKVGTDGVLLGAWADFTGCRSILDVGTGSGLIALMAAQRTSLAKITAVEVDSDAARQAAENVGNSSFKDRITLFPLSFQDFVSSTTGKFDAVVCNPPFFVNSLPSPDVKRTEARHADLLTLNDLFELSKKLLSGTGTLSLIYPFQERAEIMSVAERHDLFLWRETIVYPTPTAPPKRILWQFSVEKPEYVNRNGLIMEEERHVYTPEFCQLTKDFYLYL